MSEEFLKTLYEALKEVQVVLNNALVLLEEKLDIKDHHPETWSPPPVLDVKEAEDTGKAKVLKVDKEPRIKTIEPKKPRGRVKKRKSDKPTSKQVRYIMWLARQTGYKITEKEAKKLSREEASQLIEKLKKEAGI